MFPESGLGTELDRKGFLGVGVDGQVIMQDVGDGPLPQNVHWVGSPSSHFFVWTPKQVGMGCALVPLVAGAAAVGFAGAGGIMLSAAVAADAAAWSAAGSLVQDFFGENGSTLFV